VSLNDESLVNKREGYVALGGNANETSGFLEKIPSKVIILEVSNRKTCHGRQHGYCKLRSDRASTKRERSRGRNQYRPEKIFTGQWRVVSDGGAASLVREKTGGRWLVERGKDGKVVREEKPY